jgi:hypothetical protein
VPDVIEGGVVIETTRPRQDASEFRLMLTVQAPLRIVDQQPVFEVQAPGPRIEVAAGEQRVIVVDKKALEMKAVLLMAPECTVEQSLVDGALVSLAEATQIGLVEVRQGANRREGLFRGM